MEFKGLIILTILLTFTLIGCGGVYKETTDICDTYGKQNNLKLNSVFLFFGECDCVYVGDVSIPLEDIERDLAVQMLNKGKK